MSRHSFSRLTFANTHTRTNVHPSARANSKWAFNKHRPDYNDKERHTSGGRGEGLRGDAHGQVLKMSENARGAHKMLPSDVSLHVCVCACPCQDPFKPPFPRVQRKLISVLFFSPEDKAQAQCPASFSSAEREFWGTETEGQVITKGLAVDLVVDFIWKSNSATAFGRFVTSICARGQIGRTCDIKRHVSFFRNLPRHKWGVVATSVLFNGKPVMKIQRLHNLILVKTSLISHNLPRQLAKEKNTTHK